MTKFTFSITSVSAESAHSNSLLHYDTTYYSYMMPIISRELIHQFVKRSIKTRRIRLNFHKHRQSKYLLS